MKRSLSKLVGLAVLGLGVGAVACSAANKSTFGEGNGGSGNHNGATGGVILTNTGTGDSGGFDPGSTNTGTTGETCVNDPNVDDDKDGFNEQQGDCNDCDANVNPGAIEVTTDPADPDAKPADEDCDGEIDEVEPACDSNLAIDNVDPYNGAGAMGLCQKTTANDKNWGVVNAAYVRANGAPASPGVSVGLLDMFGPNVPPRQGAAMLALSSGHARAANQPNACGSHLCQTLGPGQAPPGFPQDVPNCSGSPDINDDIALEVDIRAPTNATGYSFDFTFYSFEYPEWVCTSFNDQFIALIDPAPQGSVNGNICFDSQKNPVSVNIAFFQVCQGPNCPLGTAELVGTGFDVWNDAGATGWLVTTAPVTGAEMVKMRFAIWDTGDQVWDSTVLLDNFQWIANTGTPVEVGTIPVPK